VSRHLIFEGTASRHRDASAIPRYRAHRNEQEEAEVDVDGNLVADADDRPMSQKCSCRETFCIAPIIPANDRGA
jgi:hypothetical protein